MDDAESITIDNWGPAVTPAQRADIANLFVDVGNWRQGASYYNPELPIRGGLYSAKNPPPSSLQTTVRIDVLGKQFLELVTTHKYFNDLPSGRLFDFNWDFQVVGETKISVSRS